MPFIKSQSGIVTQINVFTVPAGGQEPMLDLLRDASNFSSTIPGWVSASLHRSLDGTKVVNYAQSIDMEASRRVVEALANAGFLERNKLLGEAHPGLYEVVHTLEI